MSISLLSRAVGLGAVATAWILGSQHVAASEIRMETAENRNSSASYMDEFLYNQGNYSGDPVLDEAASGLKHWQVGFAHFIRDFQARGEHLMRDVIGESLPWVALGAAGLFIGGRDVVKGVAKTTWAVVGKPLGVLTRGMIRSLRRPGMLNIMARGIQTGLVKGAQLVVKNLPATALAVLGGWFFVDKLTATYKGQAAQDYFRSEMVEGEKGNSATFSFIPYGDPVQ